MNNGVMNKRAPAIRKEYAIKGIIENSSLMNTEVNTAPTRYTTAPVNKRIDVILNSTLEFLENKKRTKLNAVALKT